MNLFYKLSILMGIVVVISNYLVQFPIEYYGLGEILTYGAFTYPVTFLITDLANRAYGKVVARKIVYIGFVIGVLLTLFVSTNFSDIISIRIAIGSGLAFFCFTKFRYKNIRSFEKKKMVRCAAYIIFLRLSYRYFIIFLNCFLCNRSTMAYTGYW